ncbi:MAG TPA: type II toxin-antitoxin system VapC family toxin [Terriglobales bacterium]|nr:type II toxin-antitoxin system VapC family toxin [Terriglobales bacterium]
MTACVVDASVAAKWLLPAPNESLIDQANHLLERYVARNLQLLAPDLLGAELGNVLWKAVQRKRISPASAEKSLRRFADLSVPVVPCAELQFQALEVSLTGDRSFYDCLYIALALATHTQMITADERLVNAIGSRFPVRWLGAL